MKTKILILACAALALASCNNNDKPKEPMYTTAVKVVYNFNELPFSVVSEDTLEGEFNVYKEDGKAVLKDEKGDFKLEMQSDPNIFHLIDFNGTERTWKETNGYKLGNENRGDTLVLKYLPIKTKEALLKFGFEYRFY